MVLFDGIYPEVILTYGIFHIETWVRSIIALGSATGENCNCRQWTVQEMPLRVSVNFVSLTSRLGLEKEEEEEEEEEED